MSGLTLKQLVSFDELIAPRLIPAFFWSAEIASAVAWIDFIHARAVVHSAGSVAPMSGENAAGVAWWNLLVGVAGLIFFAILIRVVTDLVVALFRWQEATAGILEALKPEAEPDREAAARRPSPPVRPVTVSTPPPWENVPMAGMAPPPPPVRQPAARPGPAPDGSTSQPAPPPSGRERRRGPRRASDRKPKTGNAPAEAPSVERRRGGPRRASDTKPRPQPDGAAAEAPRAES